MAKKRRNFSGWLANSFNSMMSSIAGKMTTNLNSYVTPYNSAGNISNSTDYLNVIQMDLLLYCDILDNFPYFNALVNVYADACYEIISNDSFQVTCNDKQLEASINKYIKEYKLKDYILKHLHEMFKHGCFTGLISDNEITDIISPYKGDFITKKGRLLSTSLGTVQIPFYDTYTYYFDTQIKNALTIEEVKKINTFQRKTDLDKDLDSLAKSIQDESINTNSKIQDKELIKKFKECIELDTVIYRGKSFFESALIDIFRIYMRDYIFDALTLSEYMKSNCMTVTVASNKINNETALESINAIECLLNTDNINILMSYSDPLQLINQVNDKLINRVRVLPQIKDYSEIAQLNLPDTSAQLKALKEDLNDAKKQVEDNLKIPADIFTGNGNRWELSSKYEEYTNTINHFLQTVSQSICRFCVAITYRMTGKYYDISLFEHKFDLNKYISPYQKSSRVSMINDKINELTDLLGAVSKALENEAVDDVKFIEFVRKELKEADPELQGVLSLMPIKFEDATQEEGTSNNRERDLGMEERENEEEVMPREEEIEETIAEPEEEPQQEESPEQAFDSEDLGSLFLNKEEEPA